MNYTTFPSEVAVLGSGTSGQYIVKYLLEQEPIQKIIVCDKNPNSSFPIESEKIVVQFGENWLQNIKSIPLIFRSPGIHPNAISEDIPREHITTATKWFFHNCKAPITAITGSNGKSTTTALLHEMMKKQFGDKVIRGGNDSIPLLHLLKDITQQHHILLELSSFQLYDIDVSPHRALLLNISPNHLDWHKDMQCYSSAKMNICSFQNINDICITDPSNTYINKALDNFHSTILSFSNNSDDIKEKGGALYHKNTKIIDLNDIRCKTHIKNIRACVLAAFSMNIEYEIIQQCLKTFQGIPHRIEYVGSRKKRAFYNDSASTTPDSTNMALELFDPQKTIVLLGGRDKGMDYTQLFDTIAQKQFRVYLFGEMKDSFIKEIQKRDAHHLMIQESIHNDLHSIINEVIRKSSESDSILFSPACTSFDMFTNAKERGKIFSNIIQSL